MRTIQQWHRATCSIPLALAALSEPISAETIEETIVNAAKAPVSLHDADVSLAVFSNDFLMTYSIGDLTEVSRLVPNMRIEGTSYSSPQVFVRGFGTNSFNPSFEPAVGIVIDGTYFARPTHLSESLFDLQQLELLRGPQGTLFGKNTTAGVFNVTTQAPGTDNNKRGYFTIRAGEFGDRRIELANDFSATESLTLRVAGLSWDRDGRIDNSLLDRKEDTRNQDALRLQARWQLTPALTVDLKAQHSRSDYNFWPRQLMHLDDDTRAYLANFDPAIEDDPTNFQTSFDVPGRMYIDSEIYSARLTTDLPAMLAASEVSLNVLIAHNRLDYSQFQDIDVSPAELINLDEIDDYQQSSLEWTLTLDYPSLTGVDRGSDLLIGGFHFHSDYAIDADVYVGRDVSSYAATADAQALITGNGQRPFAIGGLLAQAIPRNPLPEDDLYAIRFRQTTETHALFAHLTSQWTARWRTTLALRYTQERKFARARGIASCTTQIVDGSCISQIAIGAENYDSGNISETEYHLMPRLVLRFDVSDQTALFLSHTQGFKSGGVNAISYRGIDLLFEPEENSTTELGLKSRWLDNGMSFDLVAFDSRLDNLQVLAFNGLFFDVTNAAAARSYGIETDLNVRTPLQPLTLQWSAGWLISRYQEYANAPAPIANGSGARQDLKGRKLAYAPETSSTLVAAVDFDSDGVRWGANLAARYLGSHYTDTDLDRNTKVPSATLIDASLYIRGHDNAWSWRIGGKNLRDKRLLNQVVDTALFPGTYNPTQFPGRELYTTLQFNW